MKPNRGASSIVGVILLVGVVVILAAATTVLALSLVEEEEPAPAAAFEWSEYNANHGVLTYTHVSGENLQAERLTQKGGAVEFGFTDFTIEAGQRSFLYARPGDTVRLVEKTETGESTHVITQQRASDNDPLKPLNWSATGSDKIEQFRSNFWPHRHPEGGLEWDAQSDHIRVTAGQSDRTWVLYSTTVPENSGNITVDMRFETPSLNKSGYRFYVFDQSGDTHTIWCEDSTRGSDVQIDCPQGNNPINGSASSNVTADDQIGAIVLALDMENGPTEEAQFYELEVEPN